MVGHVAFAYLIVGDKPQVLLLHHKPNQIRYFTVYLNLAVSFPERISRLPKYLVHHITRLSGISLACRSGYLHVVRFVLQGWLNGSCR